MRFSTLMGGVVVLAVVSAACGGTTAPLSPTSTPQAAVVSETGTQPTGTPVTGADASAPAVGLTGVIRGMNATRGSSRS